MNVDPFESKLDDELERARLRRIFAQGLDSVVGYLLPLKREWHTGHRRPDAGSPAPGSCATSGCT